MLGYSADIAVFHAKNDRYILCVIEQAGLHAWAVAGVLPWKMGDCKGFGGLPFGAMPIGVGRGEIGDGADGVLHGVPLRA